jgi:hypothetical protein
MTAAPEVRHIYSGAPKEKNLKLPQERHIVERY